MSENKNGHWISHDTDSRGYSDYFECSACGALVYPRNCEQELDYVCCPYCRVDMRKENTHED